jgi:hypothetical protein
VTQLYWMLTVTLRVTVPPAFFAVSVQVVVP